MKNKYLVTVSYLNLVFDDKETAMRFYAMLAEATPASSVYVPSTAPESMKGISYVANTDVNLGMQRMPADKFAMHLIEEEFREKCKPQPVEVDAETRLLPDAPEVLPAPKSADADEFDHDFV